MKKKLLSADGIRGLSYLAMAFGVQVTPDMATEVLSAGMALSGLVHVFKDKFRKKRAR